MKDQAVYIWALFFPDYAERMESITSWCKVHMLTAPDNEFSLVPKD